MKVLYQLSVLPPQMPQAEALSQEITALRHHFEGDLIFINPNQHLPLRLPRLVFGFQCLRLLRHQDNDVDLHHFYNPDPYPFPILRRLRRPVIYTIASGVGNKRPNIDYFLKLGAVTVPDERSQDQLKAWGVNNSFLVRPGIDIQRFGQNPCPLKKELRLLVGSAPWTRSQFKTKGVEALLEAARRMPNLHLVFLWRGELYSEIGSRVRKMNLGNRVTILNRLVDVNRILAGVHGAITLATQPGIVKSYPHSLLDSLAAGKPVLVSQAIPMADYVEKAGCGEIVESVTADGVLAAIQAFTSSYERAQRAAKEAGARDFSLAAMIESYRRLYAQVTGKS